MTIFGRNELQYPAVQLSFKISMKIHFISILVRHWTRMCYMINYPNDMILAKNRNETKVIYDIIMGRVIPTSSLHCTHRREPVIDPLFHVGNIFSPLSPVHLRSVVGKNFIYPSRSLSLSVRRNIPPEWHRLLFSLCWRHFFPVGALFSDRSGAARAS